MLDARRTDRADRRRAGRVPARRGCSSPAASSIATRASGRRARTASSPRAASSSGGSCGSAVIAGARLLGRSSPTCIAGCSTTRYETADARRRRRSAWRSSGASACTRVFGAAAGRRQHRLRLREGPPRRRGPAQRRSARCRPRSASSARHPGQRFGLYALNAAGVPGAACGVGAGRARRRRRRGCRCGSAFAADAALSCWRGWSLKLQFMASQTALFQRSLAHAGYTAAPEPRWPDSPAAETIVGGQFSAASVGVGGRCGRRPGSPMPRESPSADRRPPIRRRAAPRPAPSPRARCRSMICRAVS